jgi:hypothetical protein
VLEDRDLYQAFYTDYLWRLLPEVYRAADSDEDGQTGPLRALVGRLGAQIAVVRRSIDRAGEDQSIDTCDDWLIPYLGELLACNIVAGLDARAQRLDVAKTIYYRRRKGTVALLEELSADITGWNARVVEFFRRLARCRHLLDPEIGTGVRQGVIEGLRGALSGTQAGGFADLRRAGAAGKTNSAFDEFFHTADFRRGRGGSGWHHIPKLGFFLWRLRSYRYRSSTPVEDAACPGQFTIDPTGREIPLFAPNYRDPAQYGDAWVTPDQWMLPGKIDGELLAREAARLYPDGFAVDDVSSAGPTLVPLTDLRVLPERGRYSVAAPPAPGVARRVRFHHGFSSEIGAGPYDRRALDLEPLPVPLPQIPPISGGAGRLQAGLAGLAGGSALVTDSLTYTALPNPWPVDDVLLQAEPGERPVLRPASDAPWVIDGGAGATLALEGILLSGADIVLTGRFDSVTLSCAGIDPGEALVDPGAPPLAVDGRALTPSTIWIEGTVARLVVRRAICGPIRTRAHGAIESLAVSDSILQGVRARADGKLDDADVFDPRDLARRLRDGTDPLAGYLRGELVAAGVDLAGYDPGQVPAAALLAAIVAGLNTVLAGPLLYDAARFAEVPLPDSLRAPAPADAAGLLRRNRLLLEAGFPQALQPAAVATATGNIALERCTVLGTLHGHRISASESILHGLAVARDAQDGCVRFSAYVSGSRLHEPYECVAVREHAALFNGTRFGHPEYAQLAELADREIVGGHPGATVTAGARNGAEMGAFALEKNPIKARGLRQKLKEYMPVGVTPVFIYVT